MGHFGISNIDKLFAVNQYRIILKAYPKSSPLWVNNFLCLYPDKRKDFEILFKNAIEVEFRHKEDPLIDKLKF